MTAKMSQHEACLLENHTITYGDFVCFLKLQRNFRRKEFAFTLQTVLERAKEIQREKIKKARKNEISTHIIIPLEPRKLENEIYRGNTNADLTIVQYIDFQCPHCNRGQQVMDRLSQLYRGQVRFLVRHMPLDIHSESFSAAVYFEALKRQSSQVAFDWHDRVYSEQDKIRNGEIFFKQQAQDLGVDMKKLEADLKDSRIVKKIRADAKEAREFGFKGAPGYLVGGVPVRGAYPDHEFIEIIEKLRNRTQLGSR